MTTEDRRASLHGAVRGVLAYLELPPSESRVHERDCRWPHDVDDANRSSAQAVRRDTTHTIGNARRYRDTFTLRSSGFQLFGSGRTVQVDTSA